MAGLFLAQRFPKLSLYARTVAESAPQTFKLVLEALERGVPIARLERELALIEPHVWREWVEVILAVWHADDARLAPYAKTRMRQALWSAFNLALEGGDMKSAIAALDKLCKLDGLYEPIKLEETAPAAQRERLRTILADPSVRAKLVARGN